MKREKEIELSTDRENERDKVLREGDQRKEKHKIQKRQRTNVQCKQAKHQQQTATTTKPTKNKPSS